MRAVLLILAVSGLVIATPALPQAPSSKPGRECVRINDNANGLGDWDAQERNRKLWIEACKQGLALEPSNKRLKSATARAFSAD